MKDQIKPQDRRRVLQPETSMFPSRDLYALAYAGRSVTERFVVQRPVERGTPQDMRQGFVTLADYAAELKLPEVLYPPED